ncbi:DUF2778 domain-containing protein [Mesorhizobium sp. YM1C-6-2]|nr:DUF2778 domain-containing protein [Mesorhizobium sp. YM1C-6-2]
MLCALYVCVRETGYMAFLRRGTGDKGPGSSLLSRALLKTLRWAAIPCLGVALASWSVATLAGLHSAATLAYTGTIAPSPLSMEAQAPRLPHQKPAASAPKKLVVPAAKAASLASLLPAQTTARLAPAALVEEPADPFGKVVAEAKLSREKLLAAFASAGMAIEEASAAEPVKLALAMPSAERFHRFSEDAALSQAAAPANAAASDVDPLSPLVLGAIGLNTEIAYAAAEASPQNPVQLALASLALDPYGMGGAETGDDYMPDAVDLPPAKPESRPAKADAKPERKPTDIAREEAAPARKPGRAQREEPQQELAYARPDKPEGSVGRAFRNLFNDTPNAGNKVAIYDISAAVVHMPDGTKLEAHSGIGKMADNPRYVHVKMNGPTPPNTYKLTMREKRFHGVEAVRMTPVGDQTMHGRDGILAHSYLLRGGRAESHGCVAFANYPKFLKAFKQGKITHMVVVPSLSKAQLRLVSNGRGV